MRKLVFLCVVILSSCKQKDHYSTALNRIEKHSSIGASLINHPYIFEEAGLRLDSLYYQSVPTGFILKAKISGKIDSLKDNTYLYAHGFKSENDSIFENIDLQPISQEQPYSLVFSRALHKESYKYHHLEIGIAFFDSKKRLIPLSIGPVTISKTD